MSDNTCVTPTRRDEHVADTRQALVDAARTLFTEQGYAATGTEEIVAAARVTRGALYHHFHDKTDLFRAVMEQIAREVAEHLIDAELSRPAATQPGQPPANTWDEVREQGLRAFLDLCVVTDDFQRIVLVEGPAVLGHEAWDDLVARHGSNLLAEWLSRAVPAGPHRAGADPAAHPPTDRDDLRVQPLHSPRRRPPRRPRRHGRSPRPPPDRP